MKITYLGASITTGISPVLCNMYLTKKRHMKRILLTLVMMTCFASVNYAQGLRLNGYAGYVFDDKFDNSYSFDSYFRGIIKGGLQWGIGLEYEVHPEYGIELMYYRQDTEAPVSYYSSGERDRTLELGLNYILLGGVRYLPISDVFEGFGGFMAGVAIYDNKFPETGEPNSVTKFAWGVRLGGNIWISERFGLKLQTQLMSAVQAFGGGFYFGSGGPGVGVSGYSTLWQFGLGGGVVIKVGS